MDTPSSTPAEPPSPAASQPAPTVEQLQAELARAKHQAEDYLNGWRRAKADYLNLKRESEERGGQLSRFAQADCLIQLLPVYTNLQVTLRHIPSEQTAVEWVKGLRQVCQQFQQTLTRLGVAHITTVGEPFDPEQHEAVEAVTRAGVAANIVAEEVSPGYTLHGQVLLPAKVRVAK